MTKTDNRQKCVNVVNYVIFLFFCEKIWKK